VTTADLPAIYRAYIACLNQQDWPNLGLSGYRQMLERDFRDIPDLRFNIELLIADPPFVASRLAFDCSPGGKFLGLAVNGRRVSFTENVFYEFREGKIVQSGRSSTRRPSKPSFDVARADLLPFLRPHTVKPDRR
jgi:predicted ester cyclase